MPKFSNPPTAEEISAYGAELYARRSEAQHVPRREVLIDGHAPSAQMCHDNALKWVEKNPDDSVVHGWLYLDGGPLAPWAIFLAHSVLQHPDGTFFDVTPIQALEPRPFLKSGTSDNEFAIIVTWLHETTGASRLIHQIAV